MATSIARSWPWPWFLRGLGQRRGEPAQTAERNSGAIGKAWEKLEFGLRVGWGETLREKAPSARSRLRLRRALRDPMLRRPRPSALASGRAHPWGAAFLWGSSDGQVLEWTSTSLRSRPFGFTGLEGALKVRQLINSSYSTRPCAPKAPHCILLAVCIYVCIFGNMYSKEIYRVHFP